MKTLSSHLSSSTLFLLAATASVASVASAASAAETPAPVITNAPPLIVTASNRGEDPTELPTTVRSFEVDPVISAVQPSVTDILAQHAVGFLSEWTPAQTSINMRGAASDGQGRDFRSQILVLINGRRAGTANLSKLSSADIERIEMVRGPGSVVHGSQAMGGVINLITADGQSRTGGRLGLQTGTWGRFGAGASYGFDLDSGADLYLSLHWLRRGDYESGRGGSTQENTDFSRLGGTAALGIQLAERHRLELITRSDGTLDAGFRGSSYDIDNRESRRNSSQEIVYTGSLAEDSVSWTVHPYAILDEDDFHWGSEASGIDTDDNNRKMYVLGSRQFATIPLTPSNTLVTGFDLEQSKIRSTRSRTRVDGTPVSQLAPFDSNSNSAVFGIYAEDAQRFWDDRLTARGGLRLTVGEESIVETPNAALINPRTERYQAVTWSTGIAAQVTDTVTVRVGAATGFRAPTASELALDFTSVLGGQTLGNADLKPESNLGFELGTTWIGTDTWLDVVLFRNTINDRIRTVPLGGGVSQWNNSDDDSVVEGIEVGVTYDVASAVGWHRWRCDLRLDGAYNWRIDDENDNPAIANSDKIQRMYVYQAAPSITVGERTRWDVGLQAILRGPMYYDTEERLLIPQGEPAATFIHEKESFWVFNLTARWYPVRNLTIWGAINNLLDENAHPIFIATDKEPFISNPALTNGGRGNSMPGRELVLGANWTF